MTCNVTLSLKGWTIWQDCYCGSRLTCIVKTYSPCLSSHDDVNTFQFQQATIFTATLLFQPQLITTLYIQLLFYTHAHRHYFIHDSREMQEIFRRAHNNKRQYFIEPFLIRSVRCKREHFWWWFLSSPPVLSCLTTAVVIFCLAVAAGMRSNFSFEAVLHRILHPTSQQDDILSSLCSRICAGLKGPPPLFCLQLALWCNCDVGPTWL